MPHDVLRQVRILAIALIAFAIAGAMPRAAQAEAAAGGIDPATPSSAYLLGRFAALQNDYLEAARFATEALAHDPDNPALADTAFNLLVRAGRLRDSVPLAMRLLDRRPNDRLAHTILLMRSISDGAFGAALRDMETMDYDGIESFVMPLVQAWLQASNGDLTVAEETLRDYADTTGLGSVALFHRALIRDFAGDPEDALDAYREAERIARSGRLVMAMGSLYERLGRRDAAERLYAQYRADNPGTVLAEFALDRLAQGATAQPVIGSVQDGVAEALYQTALALVSEGAPQYALVYAQMSQYLRPDFSPGAILLGDIFAGLDQDDVAIDHYDMVSADSLSWWQAQLHTARAWQRLEQPERAIGVLTDLAAVRLDRADAMVAIGDVMREEHRFADAVRAYDTAMDRAPAAVEGDWSFFYRRGIALERSSMWDRAESDLVQALDLNPDHAHLLNYLGYSWIDRGENVEEAERLIREAVELLPDDGYIVDSLGWVYFRTGRLNEAVRYLERAVELLPDDAVINDHLGDAYWVVGRRAEARFQWQRALNAIDDLDDPALVDQIEGKLRDGLHNPAFLDGVAIETNAAIE